MKKSEFNGLEVGRIVRSKVTGLAYVVTANYGDRVTAASTADITNPAEWELFAAQQPAPEAWESMRKALAEAVKIIYLADNSDYGTSLWKIVELLGGKEATDMLENDEKAAYDRYVEPRP